MGEALTHDPDYGLRPREGAFDIEQMFSVLVSRDTDIVSSVSVSVTIVSVIESIFSVVETTIL